MIETVLLGILFYILLSVITHILFEDILSDDLSRDSYYRRILGILSSPFKLFWVIVRVIRYGR